jgi:hypothetical protein
MIFVYKKWRQKMTYTMERGFPSDGKTERNKKKNQKRTLVDENVFHTKKKRQMVP